MIEVRELRIGNLLEFTDFPQKGIVEVDENRMINILEDNKWLNYFHSPIPLTEEWLIKFGFEYYGLNRYSGQQYKFCDGYLTITKEYVSYSVIAENNEIIHIAKCEFVHQLQNLFYCLTGNELELKK